MTVLMKIIQLCVQIAHRSPQKINNPHLHPHPPVFFPPFRDRPMPLTSVVDVVESLMQCTLFAHF